MDAIKMCEWFSFKFNISWDRKQNPKTWIDIFIIDTIVREVISKKKDEITLWRIHRRWPDDKDGHELTFDCRTDKESIDAIKAIINNSTYFKMLQDDNLLSKDLEIVTEDITKGIADSLRESWPYYINGCCEMFLRLIDVLKKDIKTDINKTSNISEVEKFYIELEKRLTEIWQYHGNNAFFHHINAIFGYKSLIATVLGQFLHRS